MMGHPRPSEALYPDTTTASSVWDDPWTGNNGCCPHDYDPDPEAEDEVEEEPERFVLGATVSTRRPKYERMKPFSLPRAPVRRFNRSR